MKNGTLIFGMLSVMAFGSAYAREITSTLPPGVIESPYKACQGEVIVSKDKYQDNAEKWKEWEAKCRKKVQVSEDAGITRLSSLNEGVQYLNLATKVAEKVMDTLEKSRKYAQCSTSCFSGGTRCSAGTSDTGKAVDCKERRAEILKSLKAQSQKIRRELSLSEVAPSMMGQDSIKKYLEIEDDRRFNKNLRDFEVGTPNPVGHTEMQPKELEEARAFIKKERAEVEENYKKMLKQDGVKDTPELHKSWMSKALMDQVDKRKAEHREKYRQLIYEESPIFAVIDKPSKFQNGAEPVWTDKQVADAFVKLSKNAEVTQKSVKESIDNKKLEFTRDNGEALGKWLLQLVPGKSDKNDLLYYIGMQNQVEEILKEDKSLCGVASTLSNRLHSKQLQNNGVVFVASFAGGAATKGVSRGAAAVFRVGRALSGAEAAGLTGLAIGSAYLGDSFREYHTAVAETTSGVGDVKAIEAARTNVAFNLAFAPTLGTSGWGLGKIVYNSLGKKMAKDLPEVAELMKKAGTNQSAQDLAVDKWMEAKVKTAIKSNVLGNDDEALLKSEAGGKILDGLAADIQKNNPKFFDDPNNFDFFLKTAAATLKKRPGDPADLGKKAQHLFLSFNTDAFNTWDPKARLGLMKVFDEGVEELRSSYSKDPAAYAKFTTDPDSQEKIMLAALKRAGVVDDADAAAMKTCALKK